MKRRATANRYAQPAVVVIMGSLFEKVMTPIPFLTLHQFIAGSSVRSANMYLHGDPVSSAILVANVLQAMAVSR